MKTPREVTPGAPWRWKAAGSPGPCGGSPLRIILQAPISIKPGASLKLRVSLAWKSEFFAMEAQPSKASCQKSRGGGGGTVDPQRGFEF